MPSGYSGLAEYLDRWPATVGQSGPVRDWAEEHYLSALAHRLACRGPDLEAAAEKFGRLSVEHPFVALLPSAAVIHLAVAELPSLNRAFLRGRAVLHRVGRPRGAATQDHQAARIHAGTRVRVREGLLRGLTLEDADAEAGILDLDFLKATLPEEFRGADDEDAVAHRLRKVHKAWLERNGLPSTEVLHVVPCTGRCVEQRREHDEVHRRYCSGEQEPEGGGIPRADLAGCPHCRAQVLRVAAEYRARPRRRRLLR